MASDTLVRWVRLDTGGTPSVGRAQGGLLFDRFGGAAIAVGGLRTDDCTREKPQDSATTRLALTTLTTSPVDRGGLPRCSGGCGGGNCSGGVSGCCVRAGFSCHTVEATLASGPAVVQVLVGNSCSGSNRWAPAEQESVVTAHVLSRDGRQWLAANLTTRVRAMGELSMAAVPVARVGAASAALNNRVVIFGGMTTRRHARLHAAMTTAAAALGSDEAAAVFLNDIFYISFSADVDEGEASAVAGAAGKRNGDYRTDGAEAAHPQFLMPKLCLLELPSHASPSAVSAAYFAGKSPAVVPVPPPALAVAEAVASSKPTTPLIVRGGGGAAPCPRAFAQSALSACGTYRAGKTLKPAYDLLVHGGITYGGAVLSDVHVYNIVAQVWSTPRLTLAPRMAPAAVEAAPELAAAVAAGSDVHVPKMYFVFGGEGTPIPRAFGSAVSWSHPRADLAARGARLVAVFGGRRPVSSLAGTASVAKLVVEAPLTPETWTAAYADGGRAAALEEALDVVVIDVAGECTFSYHDLDQATFGDAVAAAGDGVDLHDEEVASASTSSRIGCIASAPSPRAGFLVHGDPLPLRGADNWEWRVGLARLLEGFGCARGGGAKRPRLDAPPPSATETDSMLARTLAFLVHGGESSRATGAAAKLSGAGGKARGSARPATNLSSAWFLLLVTSPAVATKLPADVAARALTLGTPWPRWAQELPLPLRPLSASFAHAQEPSTVAAAETACGAINCEHLRTSRPRLAAAALAPAVELSTDALADAVASRLERSLPPALQAAVERAVVSALARAQAAVPTPATVRGEASALSALAVELRAGLLDVRNHVTTSSTDLLARMSARADEAVSAAACAAAVEAAAAERHSGEAERAAMTSSLVEVRNALASLRSALAEARRAGEVESAAASRRSDDAAGRARAEAALEVHQEQAKAFRARAEAAEARSREHEVRAAALDDRTRDLSARLVLSEAATSRLREEAEAARRRLTEVQSALAGASRALLAPVPPG